MNNEVFGDVIFNYGFETKIKISLCGSDYNIILSADAYFEKDGITKEQEHAYEDFKRNSEEILLKVEEKLKEKELSNDFKPTLMVIKRNGNYGLVFDNKTDVENGIVILINPSIEIMSVDQIL